MGVTGTKSRDTGRGGPEWNRTLGSVSRLLVKYGKVGRRVSLGGDSAVHMEGRPLDKLVSPYDSMYLAIKLGHAEHQMAAVAVATVVPADTTSLYIPRLFFVFLPKTWRDPTLALRTLYSTLSALITALPALSNQYCIQHPPCHRHHRCPRPTGATGRPNCPRKSTQLPFPHCSWDFELILWCRRKEKRTREDDDESGHRRTSRRHDDRDDGEEDERERERRARHREHRRQRENETEEERRERKDRERERGRHETDEEREERRRRRREREREREDYGREGRDRESREPRDHRDRDRERDRDDERRGHREYRSRDRSRESHRSHRSHRSAIPRDVPAIKELTREEKEAERERRDREMREEKREEARLRDARFDVSHRNLLMT